MMNRLIMPNLIAAEISAAPNGRTANSGASRNKKLIVWMMKNMQKPICRREPRRIHRVAEDRFETSIKRTGVVDAGDGAAAPSGTSFMDAATESIRLLLASARITS